MSLLEKFDDLMSHLNGEDNSMAEKFRAMLEEHIDESLENEVWLNCLDAAGVDNWDRYEEAQRMMPDLDEEDEDE